MIQLDKQAIGKILDYVKKDGLRLEDAIISTAMPFYLKSNCQHFSLDYTVKPIDYLSLAESACATAQAGHLLVHFYIQQNSLSIDTDYLNQKRNAHDIYFIDFKMRCSKKVQDKKYTLFIQIDKIKQSNNKLFFWFSFNINQVQHGSFVGVVANISD